MTYTEAEEQELDIAGLDFESLVEELGFETILAVANSAYGRPIKTNEPAELYNHLQFNHWLDDFLDTWYFKAHYYNTFKDYPSIEDVSVNLKK